MEDKVIYLRTRNKNSMLQDLLDEVLSKSVHPHDYYEIAALLESFGWNDTRSAEIFGVEDTFDLAILIWDMITEKISADYFVEEEKISLRKRIISVMQSFIRGLIFALPMAISVAAMLTLRLSLWSYQYLDVERATSIAIGTILSFLTVGGFTQAIARRGFFYITQGFYNMARRTTFYLIRVGYVTCIAVAVIYILYNMYFKNFPFYMYVISVLYYLFLCSNWLSITVMYMLRKEFQFALLITMGILTVALLFYIFHLNIILSQVIALLIVSTLGLLLVIHSFKAAEQKEERGIAPAMQKKSMMLYSLKPYFVYGFLYFMFIYIDRIIAWSTNNESMMPYVIWFRGEYELGLDFALLMLILPMGLCEVVVTKLMKELEVTQKNSMHNEIDNLEDRYVNYYIRNMVFVIIGSLISSILIIVFVNIMKSGIFPGLSKVYQFSDITNFVFYFALAAYAFVSMALANSVILFSIAQPTMVTKSLKIALLINFVIGFAFSRWLGYYWAVLGLLIGSIIFFIITTRYVLRVFSKFDYYIYVAS